MLEGSSSRATGQVELTSTTLTRPRLQQQQKIKRTKDNQNKQNASVLFSNSILKLSFRERAGKVSVAIRLCSLRSSLLGEGSAGGLNMAEHLPFASASTKASPGALMQQPGLNLILGRGGRGDVDFVRDGQASAVVQVSLCHESEAAVGRSPLGRSEWSCLAESLSIWRRCGWCRGIEEDPSGPNINFRENIAIRNVAYRPYS